MSQIKKVLFEVIDRLRRERTVPIIVAQEDKSLLEGKTALVVGGTGGIGEAISYELHRKGCKVIVAGTNENKLREIAAKLGNAIACLKLDLCDVDSFEARLQEAQRAFGGCQIDILINSAGINSPLPFLEVSERDYDAIMDVNVKGAYFMSQTVARNMIISGIRGHILNVSSASALRPASMPYAISKWAVEGMTKGLADALIDHGITVNGIAPGPVATKMVGFEDLSDISHAKCPAGRFAMPEEIAHLAVELVSGYGDLIVGTTVYVTGGSGTISLHR